MTTAKPTICLALSLSLSMFGTTICYAEHSAFNNNTEAAKYFITPLFPIMDCENVGTIESGEVDDHFSPIFFRFDLDQSRHISRTEFVRGKSQETRKKLAYIFDLMDLNQDNKTSIKEYRAYVITSIKLADTNKNGELHRDELGIPPSLLSRRRLLTKPITFKNRASFYP